MSLRIVVVCTNHLCNKNESNDKEKKKESEKGKKLTIFIYQINNIIQNFNLFALL